MHLNVGTLGTRRTPHRSLGPLSGIRDDGPRCGVAESYMELMEEVDYVASPAGRCMAAPCE